ncbi:flagellin [Bradyrhizobium sp. USDA 4449]
MSNIVLSASVRQNLLSLQSTADLLATTQSRLSTGKKVNSALDNPTNFFTAQGLDNRASDISNLLDGINNGVQVLQAANTGITSLQKLIDSAKSIANQALQTTVGYSTKSNISTTIPGATPADLRGTTSYGSATASSNVLFDGTAGGTTAALATTLLGSAAQGSYVTPAASAVKASDNSTLLAGTATLIGVGGASNLVASSPSDGDTMTVNGHTITFRAGSAPAGTAIPAGSGVNAGGTILTDGNGNSTVYLGTTGAPVAKVNDLLSAIDLASGVKTASINNSGVATIGVASGATPSSLASGIATIETSTGADVSITGKADFLNALGLTTATGGGNATLNIARATAPGSLGSLIQDGSTLNVDGHVITFKNAPVPGSTNAPAVPSGFGVSGHVETDGNGNSTVYLQTGTIADVLKAIDFATGVQTFTLNGSGGGTLATASGQSASSINTSGQLKLSTGINADLSITGTGNSLAALGLAGNTGTASAFTAARQSGVGGISGKTLTFTSFNGGTPVNVTFGDGTNGTVKTLDQLNAQLQANHLTATIDANGVLTVSTVNEYASSTLGSTIAGGAVGGTITSSLTFTTAQPPIQDPVAQTARSSLVGQFNNILAQIDTTSQDSSFNGVNLLNGDTLKLIFNETGSSTLNINGVVFNAAGLGLSNLVNGVDFIDNGATNKVLASLNAASSTLRSEGSALGSNLSIVQVRQDFSKNLINVLQTGSSNLTLADTNEEAANSQALSTRQSIAVSALSLANQSQQSVLQLLK